MRIAFMGTPDFAVPSLNQLVSSGADVVAVYTQPPRPAGRGHKLRTSPVHQQAQALGLTVHCPENFKAEEERQAFRDLDLDLAIVVAYGLILPKAILETPKHGCWNLHGSLLPRWRGAAPIQRAIMAGDAETGVQLMQMERGLDTGPVLLSETVSIVPTDTSGSLHDKLSHIGADLLPRALAALSRGSLTATPQTEDGVMYAEKISPEEARIDWRRPAHELDCHIRGLSPFPGAWFEASDSSSKSVRCKVFMSHLNVDAGHGEPGTVLSSNDTLTVACSDGAIDLTILQRPGKSAQQAEEFLRGFPLTVGTVLV